MGQLHKGTKKQMTQTVPGTTLHLPTTVIHGMRDGGCITLSAGVHSREYVGIQALTELAAALRPEQIRGTIRILHCCNYEGFIQRSADVLPQDGKNLNRAFPGSANGTETERLAAFLESTVIEQSDFLVDLHSGGYCEALVPHVYFHGAAAPEVCAVSEAMAQLTQFPYLVRSTARNGFYSWAGQCGMPSILLERGGCGLLQRDEVRKDLADVQNILRGLGFLLDGVEPQRPAHQIVDTGYYEEAPCSGCWYPRRTTGAFFCKGEVLGEIRTIYGEMLETITAKTDGVILYQTVSLGIERGTPMIAYGEVLPAERSA